MIKDASRSVFTAIIYASALTVYSILFFGRFDNMKPWLYHLIWILASIGIFAFSFIIKRKLFFMVRKYTFLYPVLHMLFTATFYLIFMKVLGNFFPPSTETGYADNISYLLSFGIIILWDCIATPLQYFVIKDLRFNQRMLYQSEDGSKPLIDAD